MLHSTLVHISHPLVFASQTPGRKPTTHHPYISIAHSLASIYIHTKQLLGSIFKLLIIVLNFGNRACWWIQCQISFLTAKKGPRVPLNKKLTPFWYSKKIFWSSCPFSPISSDTMLHLWWLFVPPWTEPYSFVFYFRRQVYSETCSSLSFHWSSGMHKHWQIPRGKPLDDSLPLEAVLFWNNTRVSFGIQKCWPLHTVTRLERRWHSLIKTLPARTLSHI